MTSLAVLFAHCMQQASPTLPNVWRHGCCRSRAQARAASAMRISPAPLKENAASRSMTPLLRFSRDAFRTSSASMRSATHRDGTRLPAWRWHWRLQPTRDEAKCDSFSHEGFAMPTTPSGLTYQDVVEGTGAEA